MGMIIGSVAITVAEAIYKFITFLFKLWLLMPASNSFLCICKFVNRAVMRHKDNYIVRKGMSSG